MANFSSDCLECRSSQRLPDQTILKPELSWQLQSSDSGKLDAELCYVSGGMSWQAHYNLVTPQDGEKLDLIGWVTIDNQSGKSFENVRVKLMAGDVEQDPTRRAVQTCRRKSRRRKSAIRR